MILGFKDNIGGAWWAQQYCAAAMMEEELQISPHLHTINLYEWVTNLRLKFRAQQLRIYPRLVWLYLRLYLCARHMKPHVILFKSLLSKIGSRTERENFLTWFAET